MMTTETQPAMTVEQFKRQSAELASEFYAVLQGRTVSTGLVLEALMLVHRHITTQLPPEMLGDLSMAIAAYAGELLHSSQIQPPRTTH